MFETLQQLAPDPILGLIGKFKSDLRGQKIDLGVGVYRDNYANTPVLAAVKDAERLLHAAEDSKAYIGPAGDVLFNRLIADLAFGHGHSVIKNQRVVTLQTPGGCGALRVGAELAIRSAPDCTIWVSDPSWANHVPLLGNAGLKLEKYRYYDAEKHSVDFDGMMSDLAKASAGDIVLLHASCHNPSGADLSPAQWSDLAALLADKNLTPFVDMAYQGFGESIDADAAGLRLLAEELPEMLLAVSCSKNFGLYKERTGALCIVSQTQGASDIAMSHMMSIVRGIYSMPPAHGASVVAQILSSESLRRQWLSELQAMSARIQKMRLEFSALMRTELQSERFDFVATQRGMFSFLGITSEQVGRLAKDHGIYTTDNSRISLAGLNDSNIERFCMSLKQIL